MATLEQLPDTPSSEEPGLLGVPITIEEIRMRIGELSTTPQGDSLKDAMNNLKLALKKNPEASNLLLPEEIGELVKHLRIVTNTQVVASVTKDATKEARKIAKSASLTNEEFLQKALEDF